MSTKKFPERWTEIQEECYERNCICAGCRYKGDYGVCKVKYSIISQVRRCGKDNRIEGKTTIEEEL